MQGIKQGELLRLKRNRLDITQEVFAKKSGISLSTIKRYENSETIPRKALQIICEKMKWDINDFYAPALVNEDNVQYKPNAETARLKDELLEMHRKHILLTGDYRKLEERVFFLEKKLKSKTRTSDQKHNRQSVS